METTETVSAPLVTPEKPKRTRRGRKRVVFQVPKRIALPVRALWEQANEEEQEQAHRTCAAILEMWLGRSSRVEVAERLQVPPLRVWQLSQLAVSGMLAGLLKQPKTRRKGRWPMANPEEDPARLKRRIAELERECQQLKTLVGLLRELPKNREDVRGPSPSRPPKAATTGRRNTGRTRRGPIPGEGSPGGGGGSSGGARPRAR